MAHSPKPGRHERRLHQLTCEVLARDHAGKNLGINTHLLSEKLGVSERHLRSIVSQLREQGVAIAGLPATGYYLAQTSEELEECCNFLRNRALHSLTIEAQLRRISLPHLLGQLDLSKFEFGRA